MTTERSIDEEASRFGSSRRQWLIALGAVVGIGLHLLLRFGLLGDDAYLGVRLPDWPLLAVLVLGGIPLVAELAGNVLRLEFGADLLAGIAIVTAVLLGEDLAGALVVLMLSGGTALEDYAVRSASSVLHALAKRISSVAHRKADGAVANVTLDQVAVGDTLVVFPHEICPVDGTVTEGHGVMDESYLTGEPYLMSKAPGTPVLSGAINDAPAMTAATAGVAFGQNSDITAEAAGAVVMESSLKRVDEFFHIGRRMRTIALQSAVGGMALSVVGMLVAAAGYLPPVAGALAQEVIDVAVVLNAPRAALPPRALSDY